MAGGWFMVDSLGFRIEGFGNTGQASSSNEQARASTGVDASTPLRIVEGGDRIHPENARKSGCTRGTVTSTMRRAAHPSGCARCGAGAGYSAIRYQSLL